MDSARFDLLSTLTLDPELLAGFVEELEVEGFHWGPGLNDWTGPIPSVLRGFTAAPDITITVRTGWPYFPPWVKVVGIDSWHANRDNLCMWQSGDNSRRWATWSGIVARIEEWAEDAAAGFARHGQGLDPHLYFDHQSGLWVLLNEEELLGRNPSDGQTGLLHWLERPRQVIEIVPGPFRTNDPLPAGITESRQVIGRWFFREYISAPPRNLDDFRNALTENQRDRFDSDVRKVFRQVGLFTLCWNLPGGISSLVLMVVKGGTSIVVGAVAPVPKGAASRLLRAGPDARVLQTKVVLIVGIGAVGSHLAEVLARSGIRVLRLVDYDLLWPPNLIRHAAHSEVEAGQSKVEAMVESLSSFEWTMVEPQVAVLQDPAILRRSLEGVDLVVDATGDLALSELMSRVAIQSSTPFVTVALHRGGTIARVRRQAETDRPIELRAGHPRYPEIAAASAEIEYLGLETGCLAPINNAPPVSVLRSAGLAAEVCIDQLTGRRSYADEVIEVYRPTATPFDRIGTVRQVESSVSVGVSERAQADMRRAAQEAFPYETGGVLVGILIDDQPVVVTAIEIPPALPARTGFLIPAGKTTSTVETATEADSRVGYLGEWHSHPTDQGPSPIDRATMLRLAAGGNTGNPILIVVRPQEGGAQRLDARVMLGGELVPTAIETVGDLPTPAD